MVEGISRLSYDRQVEAWAEMYLTWSGLEPNERSLMIWTQESQDGVELIEGSARFVSPTGH